MLSEDDRHRLRSFRAAARQVREASVIAQGQTVQIQGHFTDTGEIDALVQLLAEEPFRSLALSIRLAYQQGEPAHFFSICKIVAREGSPQCQDRVAELRLQFHAALRHPAGAIVIDSPAGRHIFTAQQVLEHWMYGVAFHQDRDRQDSVRLLAASGAFEFSVQSTALLLAGRIIDLDDAVADLLGEARLPRI